MKNIQAGKGDKIRPFDSKTFSSNFEDIEWRDGNACRNCGRFYSQEDLIKNRDSYRKYEDGDVECKNCNFN